MTMTAIAPTTSPTAPMASQFMLTTLADAQRTGLQLQQPALTVNAMPQKSRRQNATELRNAQLSVVSCKRLLDGGRMAWTHNQQTDKEHAREQQAIQERVQI